MRRRKRITEYEPEGISGSKFIILYDYNCFHTDYPGAFQPLNQDQFTVGRPIEI